EYLKHPCQDSGKLHPPPSTGVIWEQSQDHFSKTLGVSQAPVPGFWQTSSPALHWHDMGAEPRSFFQDTSNTAQGARLLICWVAPPNAISRMPRLLRVPMISRSASTSVATWATTSRGFPTRNSFETCTPAASRGAT